MKVGVEVYVQCTCGILYVESSITCIHVHTWQCDAPPFAVIDIPKEAFARLEKMDWYIPQLPFFNQMLCSKAR